MIKVHLQALVFKWCVELTGRNIHHGKAAGLMGCHRVFQIPDRYHL